MPALSDRMRRLVKPLPTWVLVLGGFVLAAEFAIGLPIATSGRQADPAPRTMPFHPVRVTPAEPVRTAAPVVPVVPTTRPSAEGPVVTRIAEGAVVPLRTYRGRGSAVIGRVTDPKTGLSFAELGAPWRRSRPISDGPVKDGRYNLRQTLLTESYGPDDDRDWWADIDSQHLWSELDAGDSLYDAARAMLDYKQGSAFPAGTTGRDIASQPVRGGWLLARMIQMPPSPDGRKALRELSVTIAVDTGRPRPAVLWITIPDTHERLWPDVHTLVKSLKVTRKG
ncbi:hypothetical protein HII36_53340 [Nonomuraea sp. NN258]|uniref:hypothetical protein n=1 Tax=Nonomuraea antri TaxID=2730852 RepID=UPI001567EA79|nr:hypothetical protein [Nonomuraea antri]NRQ40542.1 hypothetical protein [Nonomuraea antri]